MATFEPQCSGLACDGFVGSTAADRDAQMRKLMPSHPQFFLFDLLLTTRAALKNPKVHADLKDVPSEFLMKDIDEIELALEMIWLTLPQERSMLDV